MTTPPKKITPKVHLVDGKITIDSRDIAKNFGRRHADLLKTIEMLDCSKDFTERNFSLSEYKDKTGRKLKTYEITRDGFTILVMGFTGKDAMMWKEGYIAAFNTMEQKLLLEAPQEDKGKPSRPALAYHGGPLCDAPRMPELSAEQHWELEKACIAAADRCGQPEYVVRGLCCVQVNARYLSAIPQWKYSQSMNYVARLKPNSGCFKDAAMFEKPAGNESYESAMQAYFALGFWIRTLAEEAEDGKEARETMQQITQALIGKGGAK